METRHHVARQITVDSAPVVSAQCQANGVQSNIGAAALVGDRKAIAANPNLASADNGKADTAGSSDDDATIAGAMRADAGDGGVIDVSDRAERMRTPHELFERAFAADAGTPDAGMDRVQGVGAKTGFIARGAAGLFYLGKRAFDAAPDRCRASHPGAEDPSPGARAARGCATGAWTRG